MNETNKRLLIIFEGRDTAGKGGSIMRFVRYLNPLLQWKLSTVDAAAQQKWKEYTWYKERMFEKTSTPYCPWVVVKGNNKDIARLEAIRYVVSQHEFPRKWQTSVDLKVDPRVITVLRNRKDAERME